jgi:hypothetical protein
MNMVDALSGKLAPEMEVLSSNLRCLNSITAGHPEPCKQCDANQSTVRSDRAMRGFAASLFLLLIAAGGALFPQTLCAAPAYVQSNSAVPQTSVSVPYTSNDGYPTSTI